MKFNYNQLVTKVDTYLRGKRSTSRLWNTLLPEKLCREAVKFCSISVKNRSERPLLCRTLPA